MCMIDASGVCANRCSNTVTRKAVKNHRCDECRRTIAKGESYDFTSGINGEGYPFSHKICAHCQVVAEWLGINCGGYLLEGVQEDLQEHVEEYARVDLARLLIGMKHDWKRIRRDGLMPIPKLPAPIKLGELRG